MKRRNAREYALQFIYGIDMVGSDSASHKKQELAADIETFWKGVSDAEPDAKTFAEALIRGTLQNLEVIDAAITQAAVKWKFVRIAAIDRNIMRVGAYEIMFRADIPAAVTINEALEIAKKFSTAESASFINGVLDKIAKDQKKKG